VFLNNFAVVGGGAAFLDQSVPTIHGCVFKGNRSLTDGGGLYISLSDTAAARDARPDGDRQGVQDRTIWDTGITACVFDSNYAYGSAGYGGGLCVLGPVPLTVHNCTFGRNHATNGGGIGLPDGSVFVASTIIAGNTGGGAVGMTAGAAAILQYCDLHGNTGGDWTGSIAGQNGINGNISLDPLFNAPAAGDYHLTAASPCIDAGDPAGTPDPDGSRSDMGACYFDQSFDVAAAVSGGALTLTWTASPRANEYWVYGAVDAPFFLPGYAPGFEHRLAVLGSDTLVWTTTTGVGDPAADWCYLVVAVGQDGLPILPSNRVGEHDTAWDIP